MRGDPDQPADGADLPSVAWLTGGTIDVSYVTPVLVILVGVSVLLGSTR